MGWGESPHGSPLDQTCGLGHHLSLRRARADLVQIWLPHRMGRNHVQSPSRRRLENGPTPLATIECISSPPVRARLGFHLSGWDGPHCLRVRASLGPFDLEKPAPKTSHVGPALGNVAGVVRDHNSGHLVQRELPQAIHLLAVLIASAVAVGGRFNTLVGAARLLSLSGARSQQCHKEQGRCKPSENGKWIRFHETNVCRNRQKVNLFGCDFEHWGV